MITLESEFTQKGWVLKLVRRAGFVALYARFKRSNPSNVHYEVVKIREGKPYQIAGIDFPAKEQYPKSEAWGAYGWTYLDEEKAMEKFRALESAK